MHLRFIKEAGEGPLLRTAAVGLLPPDLLNRRKRIYPCAAEQAYERAIDAQLRDLLQKPSAPLFDLIDHTSSRKLLHATNV
jgi:asparagine synthase (glutamine-hydrolysing)